MSLYGGYIAAYWLDKKGFLPDSPLYIHHQASLYEVVLGLLTGRYGGLLRWGVSVLLVGLERGNAVVSSLTLSTPRNHPNLLLLSRPLVPPLFLFFIFSVAQRERGRKSGAILEIDILCPFVTIRSSVFVTP